MNCDEVLVPCFTYCQSDYRGLKAEGSAQGTVTGVDAPDNSGGTAASVASLRERVDEVCRDGKCWSVDDQRRTVRGL